MPRYQLIDYSYPTAGEVARLLLAYKNIEFEDEQVETPDRIYQAEEESPFGILPVLLVDGEIVAQQQGICRYLANELGLTGKNNREAAMCDMIMDGLGVMFSKLRGSHISKLDAREQLELMKQMMKEDVPRYLQKYDKFLEKENHTSGYFASEDLTWCDLAVSLTFAGMQLRQPDILKEYPRLSSLIKKVTANPVVENFIHSRHTPKEHH